jgi:transcription elongation GreA/GreB family factor
MMLTPPRRRWTKSQMADTGPVHITPEGLKRLHDRLERLKKSLPEVIAEARRTAEMGDRSDNDAYKEAKGILRRTHRQIFAIEDQLKRVIEIPSGKGATGTVQIGSTVALEMDEKEKKTFRILGPFETDPGKGRISHKSPLGAALLGKTPGEHVTIQTPSGTHVYRIIKIQ